MEQNTETIYKISGIDFLAEYEPDKEFLSKIIIYDENRNEKICWVPTSVRMIWVTDGPKNYQIHAEIMNEYESDVKVYILTKKQYDRWKAYKGNRRRINVLLEVSKGDLRLKKIVANKHVDIRMTDKLYRELSEGAKTAGKSISEYCRELLEGKKPRAALTPEEFDAIMDLTKLRTDIQRFKASLGEELSKVPKKERPQWLINGHVAEWWRKYIKQALDRLDLLINREK